MLVSHNSLVSQAELVITIRDDSFSLKFGLYRRTWVGMGPARWALVLLLLPDIPPHLLIFRAWYGDYTVKRLN